MNGNSLQFGRDSGTLSPSCSGSSVDYPASLKSKNEMLTMENAGLRDRVSELERKVQEQEDELVCLRSSMADVLRRLGNLEMPSATMAPKPGGASCSRSSFNLAAPTMPKSLSRSTGNLRKNSSSTMSLTSNDSQSQKVNSIRRTVSPSPRRMSAATLINGGPSTLTASTVSSSARASSPRRPTRPLVSPAPIRKWMSSQDFGENGVASPTSPMSGGSLSRFSAGHSPSSRRFGSNLCLASSRFSIGRLSELGLQREPVYHPTEKILQIFLRGRPVNVPTPSELGPDWNPLNPSPAPLDKLKLEWVYGYRGRDCRGNLHLLPTGELVFFTASVLVLWNADDQTQRHYLGHTDDVKCMAVHPNRLLIASGQSAKGGGMKNRRLTSPSDMESLMEEGENLPHIRIWDSITLQTQQVLGIGDFERSVACVAFSKADGGNLLAAIDESYEHTLSIWDWTRKAKLTETKSANEQVFACEFHPLEKHLLVTCGKNHINFWSFDGASLQKRPGVIEGREKPKYILCVSFSEWGEILSGDSNGTISVWDGKTGRVGRQASKAHQGGVFALCCLKGGKIVSGGGKDRRLVEWTPDLKPTGRNTELVESAGPVRTLTQGKGSLILVGTTFNCILTGSLELGFQILLQAHMDELWGVCAHPLQQQFLTCGYDRTVRLWDSISKSLVFVKEIADPVHCACFHPGGAVLAVGTTVGRWLVLDALSREVVIGHKDGNDIVSCVSFSPDGRVLAVGSHDGNVYLYAVSEDARKYNRLGRCGTHSSFVTAVDWSEDGQFLRTNSGDHEVLFWQALACKPLSVSQAGDILWVSERCCVSASVAGVWEEGADGTEINSCDRSHDAKLLCVAHDSGAVRLLRFPAYQPKSSCGEYLGHGSHATCARFLQNDSRVVSVGAKDFAIFQWTVNRIF